MTIERDKFAVMCADQAAVFGVNTHYLVAVADRLSGIKDDKDGTRVGVFRITADEWEKLGKGPELTEPLPAAGLQRTRVQCIFAALQVQRAQKSFEKDNPNKSPSPADLYKIWPGNDRPGIKTLEAAIADTKALIDPADQVALEGELGGPIKLDFLTADQQSMAVKIIDAFEAAGCTVIAQAAALANAMAESSLNPNRVNNTPPEHSVGLFQCNINGGVGSGKTEEFLKNPDNNIKLIIAEMELRAPQFKTATDLKAAVTLFVAKVERPADAEGEATKRMTFAVKFLPA